MLTWNCIGTNILLSHSSKKLQQFRGMMTLICPSLLTARVRSLWHSKPVLLAAVALFVSIYQKAVFSNWQTVIIWIFKQIFYKCGIMKIISVIDSLSSWFNHKMLIRLWEPFITVILSATAYPDPLANFWSWKQTSKNPIYQSKNEDPSLIANL